MRLQPNADLENEIWVTGTGNNKQTNKQTDKQTMTNGNENGIWENNRLKTGIWFYCHWEYEIKIIETGKNKR